MKQKIWLDFYIQFWLSILHGAGAERTEIRCTPLEGLKYNLLVEDIFIYFIQ